MLRFINCALPFGIRTMMFRGIARLNFWRSERLSVQENLIFYVFYLLFWKKRKVSAPEFLWVLCYDTGDLKTNWIGAFHFFLGTYCVMNELVKGIAFIWRYTQWQNFAKIIGFNFILTCFLSSVKILLVLLPNSFSQILFAKSSHQCWQNGFHATIAFKMGSN